MSSHSLCEETSSVSETASGSGTHAESSECSTVGINSNASLRQEDQASSGNGMQSEGTTTDKSQGQPIRTSNGSSLKVCTNRDSFNEEPVPAAETKWCYDVKFSARTSQHTRVYDQNAPEANLVGNDVPSTSKFEVPDHSNTSSEIQEYEFMSEQVVAQAGEHLATLHRDLGAVDVRGKVGIAGRSRNDTSVPHEKHNTKESKSTEVSEPHDSFPAPSADVRTEDTPEHQPSEDEEDQPPPVLTRKDKEAVADQMSGQPSFSHALVDSSNSTRPRNPCGAPKTEKLVDAAEGENPESVGTEAQGLEIEPRGTGQPLEDEVPPQMEEENRFSDGSEGAQVSRVQNLNEDQTEDSESAVDERPNDDFVDRTPSEAVQVFWPSILHHVHSGIERNTVLPYHLRHAIYRIQLPLDSLTESDPDTNWDDSRLLRELYSVPQTPQYEFTMESEKLEKRITNPTDDCRADHLPLPGKEVPDSKNKSLNNYGVNFFNAHLQLVFLQENIQPPEGDVLEPEANHAFPAQLNVQHLQQENDESQEGNVHVPNFLDVGGRNDGCEVELDVPEICVMCGEVVGEHQCPLAQDRMQGWR